MKIGFKPIVFSVMKFSNILVLIFILNFKVFYSLQTNINDILNNAQKENGLVDYQDFNDSEEKESDDQCSPDEIISQILDILTPEDFEEGKENIKSDIESFNETIEAVLRLQQYTRNVSQKMSEFSKRMNSRLSETLMTIDLPSDCMTSLIRIMSAAKNGELWAIKCE